MTNGFHPFKREKRVFEIEGEYLVIIVGRKRKFPIKDIEKVILSTDPIFRRDIILKKKRDYQGKLEVVMKEGVPKPFFRTFHFAVYSKTKKGVDTSFVGVKIQINELKKRLKRHGISCETTFINFDL